MDDLHDIAKAKGTAKTTPLKKLGSVGSLDSILQESTGFLDSSPRPTGAACSDAGALTAILGEKAGADDMESVLSESGDDDTATKDIMVLVQRCKLYTRILRKMKRGHKIKMLREVAGRMEEGAPNKDYGIRYARLCSRIQDMLFVGTKRMMFSEIDEALQFVQSEIPVDYEYPDVFLQVACDHVISKWTANPHKFESTARGKMLDLATLWANEISVQVDGEDHHFYKKTSNDIS